MSCLVPRLSEPRYSFFFGRRPCPSVHSFVSFVTTRHALFFASLVAVSGCDLSDQQRVALLIVQPMDGVTLTSEADVATTVEGTQIDVTVDALGIDNSTVIELYRLESGEPLLATLTTAAITDNQAVFEGFTLRSGVNELQARVQGTTRTSNPVTVTFRDTCGKLSFVEPSMSNGESIRLGPSDDLDYEECGDMFTTRVIAGTGLPDGSEVVLLVNGRDNRTAMTVGGVAAFDEVVLDNRGSEANRLALRVASSECDVVEFDADVFVDCEGPSCSLGGPTGKALTSADDEDSLGAGLQISFEIVSDPHVSDVRLLINGDIDNAIVAKVNEGKAVLKHVALPEGTGVRVKAICTTEKGAASTDEHLFNVDTTPCAVAITTPLANTTFTAAQPMTDLEIMLSANVGSDCASVRFAALPSADCAGLGQVKAIPLDAGQITFNASLSLMLRAQGKQFVCVQAMDAAGNQAVVNAPIFFFDKN